MPASRRAVYRCDRRPGRNDWPIVEVLPRQGSENASGATTSPGFSRRFAARFGAGGGRGCRTADKREYSFDIQRHIAKNMPSSLSFLEQEQL